MKTFSLLATWIRRFLLEHLIGDRNLTHNTQISYRDALVLLLPFVANKTAKSLDRLTIEDIRADIVRQFLLELEQKRGCSISTRNQRLAAIHALSRVRALLRRRSASAQQGARAELCLITELRSALDRLCSAQR